MYKVVYKIIDKTSGKILNFSDDNIFFPTKEKGQRFIRRIKRNKQPNEIISAMIFEVEETE